MAAPTRERPGRFETISRAKVPLAAGVKAFKGAAAVLDTQSGSQTQGFYLPAKVAQGLVPRGRFNETVDNTGGTNGAKMIEVIFHRKFEVIWWNNDTAAPVTAAQRGSDCYFADDQTVSSDNSGRSAAGPVFDIDSSSKFVLVEVR